MNTTVVVISLIAVLLVLTGLSLKVVKQYERGVLFRWGRLQGTGSPACA